MNISVTYKEIVDIISNYIGDKRLEENLSIGKDHESLLINYKCVINTLFSGELMFWIDKLSVNDNILELRYDVTKGANDVINGLILLLISENHNKYYAKYKSISFDNNVLKVNLSEIDSLKGILSKVTLLGELKVNEEHLEINAQIK